MTALTSLLLTSPANAHTSEQAFVLLLPTGIYTVAGVSVVAVTMGIMALLPKGSERLAFGSRGLFGLPRSDLTAATSVLSFGMLLCLIWIGFTGSPSPLKNLLPLVFWTLFWMGFLTLQAVFGNLWHWLNPWTGPYRLLPRRLREAEIADLPERFGSWPGAVLFLAFGCFMLADIAPEDPSRLATIIAAYWVFTFICMILFGGERWLARGEFLTMLLDRYALLSIFARRDGQLRAGMPCWQLIESRSVAFSVAVLVLLLLGTGSFDGVNETFWWLAKIGINPLEFPGRSAVFWPTTIGLLAANALLLGAFALVIWTGLRLAGSDTEFTEAFGVLAMSMLPIALAYHAAHYLTAYIVQIQYALLALNDPLATGADWLGFGQSQVTTGFFNTRDTVRIIWLSQAGVVVIGHVLSVLVGHVMVSRLFSKQRDVLLAQLPLALFMILYTLFGLWLLATPRGA
ncbi:MAG: hypothetical protein AB3N20_02950 [Rhizobiaceae bacterium]